MSILRCHVDVPRNWRCVYVSHLLGELAMASEGDSATHGASNSARENGAEGEVSMPAMDGCLALLLSLSSC